MCYRSVFKYGMLMVIIGMIVSPSVCIADNTTSQSILTIPFINLKWNGTEITIDEPNAIVFYPALTEFYADKMFTLLNFENNTDTTVEVLELQVIVTANNTTLLQGKATNEEAYPLSEATTITETTRLINLFPLAASTTNRTFLLNNRTEIVGNLSIIVDFEWNGQVLTQGFELPVSIQSLNAFDAANPWMLSTYISPSQPEIVNFVRQVLSSYPEATENWEQAAIIFDALALYGMRYQRDPTSRWTSGSRRGLDTVFLPVETLSYRQGDCDDLSVLYATALESVGIPTRLIFAPQHVWVAFAPYDMELSTEELRQALHMQWDDDFSDYSFGPLKIPISELYGRFDDGYLWIPVETTMLAAPEYSFLGINGIGWVQNNFTAAVEAGRIQMRVPDSELESYRTADIQRNLGIRPANLTPQVTNISALPNRAELTALYQTERWHSSGTHLWLFTRRNWWWGIPTLIICVYFVWRTLNNWTAKAMGYDKSQPPLKDPEEEYEKFQEHERIRLLQEYKQCPRCGTPLLRTTLVCPSCGLGVCRCGGVIHPGTRQCQQCGATFTMGCPQCGSPIQFDQYYCEKCGAKFCVECSGIIDISTMKCTRCGETYQRICSECNTANDPETVVCKKCGNRLL